MSLSGITEKPSEALQAPMLTRCHGSERFGEVMCDLGKGEFTVDA